jgi:hypothetical protein
MALIMTQHARRRIAERGIDVAWIERTVALPMRVGPCPNHPDRTRAWRRIPERGNRVLRGFRPRWCRSSRDNRHV